MPPIHRSRQPGASLAQKAPPRIVEFEPIPEAFTPHRPAPFRMDLSEILAREAMRTIADTGRVIFRCFGDPGGLKRPGAQSLVTSSLERSVADARVPPTFDHIGKVIPSLPEQAWRPPPKANPVARLLVIVNSRAPDAHARPAVAVAPRS